MGETTRRGFLGLLSGLFVSGGALTRKKLDEMPARAEMGEGTETLKPSGIVVPGEPQAAQDQAQALEVHIDGPLDPRFVRRIAAELRAEARRRDPRYL